MSLMQHNTSCCNVMLTFGNCRIACVCVYVCERLSMFMSVVLCACFNMSVCWSICPLGSKKTQTHVWPMKNNSTTERHSAAPHLFISRFRIRLLVNYLWIPNLSTQIYVYVHTTPNNLKLLAERIIGGIAAGLRRSLFSS